MHVPVIDHVIAVLGTSLLTTIAVVLARKKAYRQFPWFFSYTIYHIAQTVITESIAYRRGYDLTYFWVFFYLQILSLSVSFAVIYEVFSSVMEPYSSLNRLGKWLFLLFVIALGTVAALLVVLGHGPGLNRLAYAIFVSFRSLRIVQLGLILALFMLSRSIGLSWRSYTFGVALGYGIYSAVDLVLAAIRLEYGEGIWHIHSVLSTLAFNGMLITWLWYIRQSKEVAQPVRVIPYNDIAKWNEKLEELLKRKAA
jgi:hypothetical protein